MPDLDWPDGFDRTDPGDREPYPHGFRVTRSQAFDNILEELRKMDGARNVQLDTGAEHQQRNPNKPYANASYDDPGVVARFERDGQQFAVPCDRWDNPRDNAQAIAKYLDAKRALERYGVETVDDEFATQALPGGDDEDVIVAGDGSGTASTQAPHEVLGVAEDAPDDVVEAVARRLSANAHPDNDGDREEYKRIQQAKAAMLDG
ncbi:J domain-containing protein [Haloarcula pellucida]|uniref:DnaJ domain-containing protein n=1 Tax=Haloarcula pellucida TaxID=1427151 RepID=A0A830GFA8_9EURY|nr:J domain-containing protein [Halomicroarcula pellucida]MBX0346587.1 J domain-containing protein [Halomicroarcula pellucida]GGN84431.1 hypothetical protein GCM10009030_00060 [Halomicroarcula pellucida]